MTSKYFSLIDITRSQIATRLGLNNSPNELQMVAIEYVMTHIVDKVKDKFAAVSISSFFRSEELNTAVRGSETSQHCKGEAVDLDSSGNVDNLAIFNFVKDCLVFDQLILEYPDACGTPGWVHVSFVNHPKKNRMQVLVKLASDPPKKYRPYGEYKVGMI